MHYCNISLKNFINEILQYFNKNNDIALIMHQRALIQGSACDKSLSYSMPAFSTNSFGLFKKTFDNTYT